MVETDKKSDIPVPSLINILIVSSIYILPETNFLYFHFSCHYCLEFIIFYYYIFLSLQWLQTALFQVV